MIDLSISKRLNNTIFVTQSFFSASQIAIITLLSIVAVALSGNEVYAGLPSTTLTLSQSLAALPTGLMMGRIGRRRGLAIGYSISMIGAAVGVMAIMSGSFETLLISSALIGVGRASGDQSRFVAGELFPENMRARMIGRIVFAGTIGAVVGPLLVAPSEQLSTLLGFESLAGPWVIGFVFYGLAATIAFIGLRPEPLLIARQIAGEDDVELDGEKPKRKLGQARPIRELVKLPAVQLAILSMLISQTVMVTLMVITPLHMSHHNHATGAVSLVISVHTLGMYAFSALTGRLIDRFGRLKMMIAGAVTLIASAIISPLSSELIVLLVGLFLLGLGWNFGYIAGSTLLADALLGEERTRMQGANDMLVAGAAALGSLSSGPLFAAGGYVTVAIMGLLLTLLFLWVIRLIGAEATRVPMSTVP